MARSTKRKRRLLTRTGGYLAGYDYTLNPFVGCAYGCLYCYVQALPIARFRRERWGSYADIKPVDPETWQNELRGARRRGATRIFMSSSTDPYQPAEWRAGVTRSVLMTMAAEPSLVDFLFVQTRSPLVVRDIDLLKALGDRVLVSVTLETDREDVRRRFAPHAPTVRARIRALESLRAAGIPVQVAVAPLLPSSPDFPHLIASLADFVAIDDWFVGDGARGTRSLALGVDRLYLPEERDAWFHPRAARTFAQRLADAMARDRIYLHQQGFLPTNARHPFDEGNDSPHA
ncbi:SPL family radical SAM protein [Alicyclobacillus vulcanalis]|uniref:DNA repair photolyase n=1 Tax=Alicyclobacillus vulcanalis TaxID=252246 RepID=A0A1N7KRZ2_9BACL|nr:radical SAM protein [Alicyclobacillus vulcanalis]SIS64359.1 DNA repair photolyase [Alicyclobacillus vulcanalis]